MGSGRVVWGIVKRNLLLIPRLPSTFVPSLVMPVFFTIVFAGGFSALARLPGFPARETIDWFVPMSALMGASFAGVTTGMGVARDLEIGFYDRLLVSPVSRASLLVGSVVAAVLRSFLPVAIVLVVALLGGAHFFAGLAGVGTLVVACMGLAMAASAWSVAIALRTRTLQSVPLMQVGIFLSLFLSTAQMPLELLTGWLHQVARFNPMTNVLALARQGFLGDVTWSATWPGLVALAGMIAVLVLFAARSMQRATP